MALEDAQHLAARHAAHLSDAVGVSENNTNLRGSQTLPSELAYMLLNLRLRDLEPARW